MPPSTHATTMLVKCRLDDIGEVLERLLARAQHEEGEIRLFDIRLLIGIKPGCTRQTIEDKLRRSISRVELFDDCFDYAWRPSAKSLEVVGNSSEILQLFF